jgi:hypothetical protein
MRILRAPPALADSDLIALVFLYRHVPCVVFLTHFSQARQQGTKSAY